MTARLIGEHGPEIAFGQVDSRLLLILVRNHLDSIAVGDPRVSSTNQPAYRRIANELRSHQERCNEISFASETGTLTLPGPTPTMATMSIRDAATAVGCSEQYMRRVAANLGGFLVGGRWRIPTAAVEQHRRQRKEHTG